MTKYSNPIIPGFYPDPSICRVDNDYYLVTSSFEYFPGVPIFHSHDLINWKQIGHCLTRKSQLYLDKAKCSGGIYAPTIRYHDGTFYMVTTNTSHKGNFYVTAKDPGGEWSDPIWVEQGGIDPTLYFDDDGKVYFTSNSGADGVKKGIIQAEIDIATGKLTTPSRLIWEGTGGSYPEAPHLYKMNGLYYLMIAEGGTEYGHMVTIARSTSPWGPFESCPRNPILTHRNRGGYEVQGTGHGDLIKAQDGSWWIVFLGFRNSTQFFHHLGRETFVAPVSWDEDGWPVIYRNGTVDIDMEAECLPQHPKISEPERDDFDSGVLNFPWNFLRNPQPEVWNLDSRPGWLCLKGNCASLNDIDSPAFIGRRQQHFNCEISAIMDFYPQADGDEAGLTVFYNNEHHYEIAITRLNGVNQLIVRRTIGDLSAVVVQKPIGVTPVIFEIKADRYQYQFRFSLGSEPTTFLCQGATRHVSTEAALCSFTGVYFGLYATGNGKDCSAPAYFDWFDYRIY